MKERLFELVKKYWIEFFGASVLCFVVLVFSVQIKQFFGVRQNKTEFAPVAPVDHSKERDIMSCIQNRIAPEVLKVCSEGFDK